MEMNLTSSVFENGKEIPLKYTCEGEDISPQLAWEGVPPNTRSLALIVHDPDVPSPENPKRIWVHWVIYNMPPDAAGLAEDVASKEFPPGTCDGLNDWKITGYGGPCFLYSRPPCRYCQRVFGNRPGQKRPGAGGRPFPEKAVCG